VVRKVEFVSDRMLYTISRGHWCYIIILKVHVPCEDKSNDIQDNFYEELGWVFDQFPKYDMKIMLGDFYVKVNRENIFKLTIGNKSSHVISNANAVTVVNFATSKNLTVNGTMSPHCNIHKYTWTCPEGKMHNQTDHILTHREQHSSIPDV
jgi:hypothetical protein